jgi:hypothetical protein
MLPYRQEYIRQFTAIENMTKFWNGQDSQNETHDVTAVVLNINILLSDKENLGFHKARETACDASCDVCTA